MVTYRQITLDIHSNSFKRAKLIQTYIQYNKPENFCILVISNNKSFISQILKVVRPLRGKFDFSVPKDLRFKVILMTKP